MYVFICRYAMFIMANILESDDSVICVNLCQRGRTLFTFSGNLETAQLPAFYE